jgi:hypothetical protein
MRHRLAASSAPSSASWQLVQELLKPGPEFPVLAEGQRLHPDCRLAVFDEVSIRHLIRPSFRHASKERFALRGLVHFF